MSTAPDLVMPISQGDSNLKRVQSMVTRTANKLPAWVPYVALAVITFIGGWYINGVRASDRLDTVKGDVDWLKADNKLLNDSVITLKAQNDFSQTMQTLSKQIEDGNKQQTENINRLIDAINKGR